MRLFIKKVFVFLLPILLLIVVSIGSFYYYDPFQVLNPPSEFKESIVGYNEEFVATERYLRNPKNYGSFIFGSSRAGAGFRLEDWATTLRKNDDLFLFASSNETIFGILGKIKLIEEVDGPLHEALIIIDTDKTFHSYENSKGHIFIKHYRVSQSDRSTFITTFLKDYIFSGFFIRFLDFKMFKTERPYMKGYLDMTKLNSTKKYESFVGPYYLNQIIKKDSIKYYEDHQNLFFERPKVAKVNPPMISERGISYLKTIKSIFDKKNTSYKFVIGPLYNQQKINAHDLQILRDIFGASHVYDYSGKNEFTENKGNYLEDSHYRPHVGAKILKDIYAEH